MNLSHESMIIHYAFLQEGKEERVEEHVERNIWPKSYVTVRIQIMIILQPNIIAATIAK